MIRRITSCVIFVTLIWGAFAENQDKIRDIFKSNMTRNDFSNLLQSLIKLNEQRVKVLQKLYRLEDYGVLSEVLRSGDMKSENKNQNQLFLVVLSKNETNPSRRNVDFQVVDSVLSYNNGSIQIETPENIANNNSNKEHVLETFGRSDIKPHIQSQFKLPTSDNRKVIRAQNEFEIDDRNHILSTTIRPHKIIDRELIDTKKSDQDIFEKEFGSNLHRIVKNSPKASVNNKLHKEYRSDAVSKGKGRFKANLDAEYDENNGDILSSTENYHNQYPKLDISANNVHNTQIIKIKDMASNEREHKIITNESDDIDSSDILSSLTIETSVENYHSSKNSKINDDNQFTINLGNLNENSYDNKFTIENNDVSIENYHDIKSPKINKEKSTEISNLNMHSKRNTEKNQVDKFSEMNAEPNNKGDHRIINVNIQSESTFGNDHGIKYLKINREVSKKNEHRGNKYPNINKDNDRVDIYSNINRDISKDNVHDIKYRKITTKSIENDHVNNNPNDFIENFQDDKLVTLKELSDFNNYKKPKMDLKIDKGNYDSYDKLSIEDYGGDNAHRILERDRSHKNKPYYLNLHEIDKLEKKPASRKNFKNCLNKKALKLCTKSCNTAYKNVCQRLKCTSRSKKALKKECKASCKKTFSSKYSDEDKS